MTNHEATQTLNSPESTPAPTSPETEQVTPVNGEATQVAASHETPHALTNRTVSARLRFLMAQLTEEPPPPLSTRLIKRLTPTPEEHLLLSLSDPTHKEAAA